MHRPQVVLLDEPTLGLNFEAQVQIREFVAEYVARTGACVLLTSHYLADIEALCQEVMTISGGHLTYRGPLRDIQAMASDTKRVRAQLVRPMPESELSELDLRWHFIGQLQTKKARQAAQYAHAIHSIDRERLVEALSTAEVTKPIDAFVQVNLTDDPGRGGAAPAELERIAERVLETATLRLRGVMAVAPLPEEEEATRAFARLREYSERLRALAPEASDISAGMTHDYVEAIAAGATHLRIGSAITGKRPIAG